MRRPFLNEIPLEGARSGGTSILIGPDEWDEDLQAAYNAGHTLIEFGSTEMAVHAYRKVIEDLQPELFTKDRIL
jgi:hypothetical protein